MEGGPRGDDASLVSMVVPCYNEEDNVESERLSAVFAKIANTSALIE